MDQPIDENPMNLFECGGYKPLVDPENLRMASGEDKVEDVGCDCCFHWNSGRCQIYQREEY